MEHHVGIDVSLDLSSVCVLDAAGKVVREAKVASEPEALVAFLRGLELPVAACRPGGWPVVAMALRRPARGRLRDGAAGDAPRQGGAVGDGGQDRPARRAWHRAAAAYGLVPTGAPQVGGLTQEVRALLGARKQLQIKVMDLEQTLRGLLRGFGLKVVDRRGIETPLAG